MDHRVFNLDESDHIITIASAGCNALDYIIEGAAVTAVDFNLCQIALTELKKVAIQTVEFEVFFEIFSKSNMDLLKDIYPTTLRPHLTPASAEFWDTGIHTIKSFMYSGTSGNMSYVLFRILFPLFGLGFVRNELLKNTPRAELLDMISKKSRSIRAIAWLMDNIMLRGGCCFAGVPERQMNLGMHRPNNLALVIERVFFKSDLVNDNYFYSGYFLGYYKPDNAPRYLRKENYAKLQKYIGKLKLVHGTMLDAIDNTDKPFTIASLLDHMDWMTEGQINEEMCHLFQHMDLEKGKIFWRTFADDVHSASLQWLNPVRVGHADDEDSDDRVGMYWTTWIANTKDCKVNYDERVPKKKGVEGGNLIGDLVTGAKIVTFPLWKGLVASSIPQEGHAKDMESFYKYQKDSYDAFREDLLHGKQPLMEDFPLSKKGGMVWVDVGGGTARNLEYFTVETIRKHFKKIYIVDISASLLTVASNRVKLMGLEDIVEVIEHDCTRQSVLKVLPKKGTVDAVTMSYSFSMIPDQKAAMSNIITLLKPKTGFVAIADFFMKGNYDDFLPNVARRFRSMEAKFHKWWFGMDHVHLLTDAQTEFAELETIWDNRFRGGVPFLPFLQPFHGVKIMKKK